MIDSYSRMYVDNNINLLTFIRLRKKENQLLSTRRLRIFERSNEVEAQSDTPPCHSSRQNHETAKSTQIIVKFFIF
jgi:hypothetical protein